MFMCFKTIQRMACSALVVFFSAQLLNADTVTLNCPDNYYKYEKKFLRDAEVFVRENASWQPWCPDNISINDKGASCTKSATRTLGSDKLIYTTVDEEDLGRITDLLIKRHSYCRTNIHTDLCEPKIEPGSSSSSKGSFSEYVLPSMNEFKLYEEENNDEKKAISPSWSHNCHGKVYFGPIYESENFHLLSQDTYVDMHLPKLGDKKCGKYEFVVENTIQYNEVTYVDFILKTVSKVATDLGIDEKNVQDCNLVNN